MNCTRYPRKKNQVGEFILEIDFCELGILATGAEHVARDLEEMAGRTGDLPNGVDKESLEERREMSNQILKDLSALADASAMIDNE